MLACLCAAAYLLPCIAENRTTLINGPGEEDGWGGAEERGESFLRATQHSLAVQLAVVHDFVAGLVVNTLDSAAHPAKPTHVAAEGGVGVGRGRWEHTHTHTQKQSPSGTTKIAATASNGAKE